VEHLRSAILDGLRQGNARPLQAASIGKQLTMYVDLVKNDRLSGSLAKEAFEEAQIGEICGHFSALAAGRAGQFPTKSLQVELDAAWVVLHENATVAKEAFHFGSAWQKRLEKCGKAREQDLHDRNGEQALSQWQVTVSEVAEQGSCFFLGPLARLLRSYAKDYGAAFGPQVQARAVDFASALQRARLVECVRLRDFLWPIIPWLAWPVCSFYLRGGAISGMLSLVLHMVALSGIYVMLQTFRQLPAYLDVDYPVLRHYPLRLDIVMRAPPLVPWGGLVKLIGIAGAARSAWRTVQRLAEVARPAGSGHEVAQLVNLELKVNMFLKRSEAMFKQELAGAAVDAAEKFDRGELKSAQAALIRGLCLLIELPDEDMQLVPQLCSGVGAISAAMRTRAAKTMDLAGRRLAASSGSCASSSQRAPEIGTRTIVNHGLWMLVAKRDWQALLVRMADLLEAVSADEDDEERSAPAQVSDSEGYAFLDESGDATSEIEALGEPEEEAEALGSVPSKPARHRHSLPLDRSHRSSDAEKNACTRRSSLPAMVPTPTASGVRQRGLRGVEEDDAASGDDANDDEAMQPSESRGGGFFYWTVIGGSAAVAVAALTSHIT